MEIAVGVQDLENAIFLEMRTLQSTESTKFCTTCRNSTGIVNFSIRVSVGVKNLENGQFLKLRT